MQTDPEYSYYCSLDVKSLYTTCDMRKKVTKICWSSPPPQCWTRICSPARVLIGWLANTLWDYSRFIIVLMSKWPAFFTAGIDMFWCTHLRWRMLLRLENFLFVYKIDGVLLAITLLSSLVPRYLYNYKLCTVNKCLCFMKSGFVCSYHSKQRFRLHYEANYQLW